jgi:Fe-Mn family superoxide dismutase
MHVLDPLPYDYAALEPHFDAETMRLHHDKHHQTYVDKLNDALAGSPDLADKPVAELLRDLDSVPEAIRLAVRNHGGGHLNHDLFWTSLSPDPTTPSAELTAAIDQSFGSLEALKERLTAAALGQFGSGWGWLVKRGDKLEVMVLPNQDSPLSTGDIPLLNVDVWEHAYYLKYQNRRADYLTAWWNLVNWPEVERRWQQ